MRKSNEARKNRPGQKGRERVFCPIFNRWISDIRCFEITIGRRLYDNLRPGEEDEIKEHSQAVREAVINSGRVFPEQLEEVTAICRFCEQHCLGKRDGPTRMPPYRVLVTEGQARQFALGEEIGKKRRSTTYALGWLVAVD